MNHSASQKKCGTVGERLSKLQESSQLNFSQSPKITNVTTLKYLYIDTALLHRQKLGNKAGK